ncbi:GNAT family N-acetyltransferase [Flocculibacter collagenilyticus]|uniref:GNAT family N-acetyltransferase n=1 Tax=Flocculibacter collagenilyticus TaxID=2744479 RepID=UPI0018F36FA7|nr:GNAT family N-acetyltransferase [Flocculibacter collagenilyticus]
MLSDDELGSRREDVSVPLNENYVKAFNAIAKDENNVLVVAKCTVSKPNNVLGVVQLTFIPNLTYVGAWRAQIEGVRVHKLLRNSDIGKALINHCIQLAQQRSCCLVQLTCDKLRPKAHNFYEKLGFEASHVGFKLKL